MLQEQQAVDICSGTNFARWVRAVIVHHPMDGRVESFNTYVPH